MFNSNIKILLNQIKNTFCQYFYTFGIDSNIILNDYIYKLNNYLIENEKIYPSLLNKFPPFNKTNSYIDEKILINHCFPNGLKFIECFKQPNNEFFYFKLDNLLYPNKSNNKIYFTGLLFYESLLDYYKLKLDFDKINDKQNIINNDNNNLNKSLNNIDDKANLNYNDEQFLNLEINDNIEQIRFTQSPKEKKNKIMISPIPLQNNLNNFIGIKKEMIFSTIYIPKVILLSSIQPYIYEKTILLKKIYDYFILNKDNIIIPLEKIIENILLEIPEPPPGYFSIIYKDSILLDTNNYLAINRSPINKIPLNFYKMQYLFYFNVNDIIEILRCLILEIPIIFFSNDKEILTNIVESFLNLIFPLEYYYPNISILPVNNCSILEIYNNYVIGINSSYENNFFEKYNINLINKTIKICDIENKKIFNFLKKANEQILINLNDLGGNNEKQNNSNNINNKTIYNSSININNIKNYIEKIDLSYNSKLINNNCNKNISIELPYYKKLKLEQNLNEIKKVEFNNREFNYDLTKKIIKIFFNFFISLLYDYNTYMYNEEKDVIKICKIIKKNFLNNLSIKNIYKYDEFIKNQNYDEQKFYSSFLKTKIFLNFIINKYYFEQNIDNKIKYLLFDEKIISHRNKNKNFFQKNIKTPFLSSKEYALNAKFENYITPESTLFNKEESNYIKKNKNKLYNYFQKYNASSKTFKYYIFPKFIYDNIFFNNKNYFNPSLKYSKIFNNLYVSYFNQEYSKYEKIYSNYFLQYHMDLSNHIFKNEFENYIYLLWLKIFSSTFYYYEENEKYFRFEEMMNNINKLFYYDISIISEIFVSIYKYSSEKLLIKFYEKMEYKNYTHFSYLICKLLKEDNNTSSLKKKLSINSSFKKFIYFKENNDELKKEYEFNLDKNKYLKKRTFNSSLEEEYIINNFIKCPSCKQNINLAFITLRYDLMIKNKQILCPLCNKKVSPKVYYKEKNEINYFELYNPWSLYENFENEIFNDYCLRLDLKILKKFYRIFYLNCIWLFALKGLSYEILLRYKDTWIKNGSNLNKNLINTLLILYHTKKFDNKILKIQNLNKINININNNNINKLNP